MLHCLRMRFESYTHFSTAPVKHLPMPLRSHEFLSLNDIRHVYYFEIVVGEVGGEKKKIDLK